MTDNIIFPYARTLTDAKLPWDTPSLIAKCSFSCNHLASRYCIHLPRSHRSLSVIEVTGLDTDDRICGKLTTVLVPLKNQPVNKATLPSNTIAWKTFSKEEIAEFSRNTNDNNPIHFQESPVVQGLLIFSQLLHMTKETHGTIRFLSPLHADEKVYLLQQENAITGYAGERICFHYEGTNTGYPSL